MHSLVARLEKVDDLPDFVVSYDKRRMLYTNTA